MGNSTLTGDDEGPPRPASADPDGELDKANTGHGPVTAPVRVERAGRSGPAAALLALALIVSVLAALGLGAYLYETWGSSSPASLAERVASPDASEASGEAGDEGGIGTTGADSRDAAAPDRSPAAAEAEGDADATAAAPRATSAATPAPAPSPAAATRATTPAPAPSRAEATRAATPASAPSAAPAAARPAPTRGSAADLSGSWTLTTRVESSSVDAFEGLRLGYRIQLQQRGNRITGRGEKVSENGQALRGSGRTPIAVQGTVEGDRLNLSFTEEGARRQSSGTFELRREDDDLLRGRFSSGAARSAGGVEARRR